MEYLIKEHYKHLASEYNSTMMFSEGYHLWLVKLIISALKIDKKDYVVDLGGGTGCFSSLIYNSVKLENDILCVDTCKEMLKNNLALDGVSSLCTDALSFSKKKKMKYNKVLIKEAVHHFKNREVIWNNLFRHLPDKGKILIITRPQETDFPFFKAAAYAFEQSQPDYSIFLQELKTAGFNIKVQFKSYHFKYNKHCWFEMLQNRFMSNLSGFNDNEISSGINELKEKYKKEETLTFNDNLILISGTKE